MDINNWSSTISIEDSKFEEDVARNHYSIKHWLRYVDHKRDLVAKNMIYERALSLMPGSYKLWFIYLTARMDQVKDECVLDACVKEVNNTFERSLVFMHKMPRIWIEYCKFLIQQNEIIRARRTLDRALQALPITQHTKIWPIYLRFIKQFNIPDTALRVYRRYLQFQPEDSEDFIEYLLTVDRLDEAAVKLGELVNNEQFVSKYGKSKHQLWTQLAEIMCKNPDKIHSLDVDAIIREGITRYLDQQGKLWVSLAQYYIRSGLFEKARDIFEEGINSVKTIRDFSHIFDAYTQSEEGLIQMQAGKDDLQPDEEIELDLRMLRYEDVIERRPLLLNSVALRQNPHNVEEWLKRVELLKEKPIEVVNTFTDAVEIVDAKKAVGKYPSLWIEFAKFYELAGQLDDARMIFEKATTVNYVKVDDLATVWCEWAEMELRSSNVDGALRVMQSATALPTKKASYFDQTETVQRRVHKSLRVWSLYADLEESFGTFHTTKAVYDKIIDLKIVTPQIIMNYGLFLEENKYYEEAFKAYEKGVAIFRWPNVYDIWNTYLVKFLQRYKGAKLERTRDLFEECLISCPEKYIKQFYLLYAKYEEDYGLARNSMDIYEAATQRVSNAEKAEVFAIWIKRAAELFGITRTRPIYEKAISVLPDVRAVNMSLKYAEMERKLGEIDRARSIFAHASQMSDPRTSSQFWEAWKAFEMKHGNEDTIREMLRIKRSVMVVFNTQVNYMSAQMMANRANALNNAQNKMDQLDELAADPIGAAIDDELDDVDIPVPSKPTSGLLFVPSQDRFQPASDGAPTVARKEVTQVATNQDEIDLGDDDDDADDDEENDDPEEPEMKKAKTLDA